LSKKGVLYLIPNSLGSGADAFATQKGKDVAAKLGIFIVEEIKSARRLLRQLGVTRPLEELQFHLLNEHTREGEWQALIQPLLNGEDIGLISEAGVPCVADPGSVVVDLAHQNNLKVVPLSGPSSIIMALMASGLNGQTFTFNGYLPREKSDRIKKIRQMEQLAIKGNTQLFMDAPYRNNQLYADLLETCRMDTKLCIATNVSMDNEHITTREIGMWHTSKVDLHKQLVMFVLGKGTADKH
jgi:16S rRNA (cytidine1402-2'-O)-methyltransferase